MGYYYFFCIFLRAIFRFKNKIKQNKTSLLLLKITRDLTIAITMLLGSIGVRTRARCQILSQLEICITEQDGFMTFRSVYRSVSLNSCTYSFTWILFQPLCITFCHPGGKILLSACIYHLKYRVRVAHSFGMFWVYSLQLQIKLGACRFSIQKCANAAYCISITALFVLY